MGGWLKCLRLVFREVVVFFLLIAEIKLTLNLRKQKKREKIQFVSNFTFLIADYLLVVKSV